MRFVTITLAVLTVAAAAAAITLAAAGRWHLIASSALVFLAGFLLAAAGEHGSDLLRRLVDEVRLRAGRVPVLALSIASAGLPVGLLLMFDLWGFAQQARAMQGAWFWPIWLLGYGAVSGPYTLFAAVTRLQERTLCGIHAYLGHLLYLLISLLWLRFAVSWPVLLLASALLLVPAAIIGVRVALAGRSLMRSLHA